MAIHPSARIASTARVAEGAEIGPGVEIGDFCVIEDDVAIGEDSRLESHVVVKRWTTLGRSNQISVGTALGTDPLDTGFSGERSYLRIGDENIIREHYTISRGSEPESETVIGDRNFIMTSGHIAHDCRVGSDCVICSCALIAGYVEIEDGAFISGPLGVHQFSRIGRLAMIGGMTRVNRDVPPYFLYSGYQITPRGVNVVGLRRAGLKDAIPPLKKAFRLLYRSSLPMPEALARIDSELEGEHIEHLVRFIRGSKRGVSRR